jgi:VCBS repeat protein
MGSIIACLAVALAAIAPDVARAERTPRDEGAAAADFDGAGSADLPVGDLDRDGRDDVFSPVASGHWSVSWGAQTTWAVLPYQLSTLLSELVFEDFDGDGRTDFTGDGRCDALRYERRQQGPTVVTGARLFGWRGLGTSDWLGFSWNTMR